MDDKKRSRGAPGFCSRPLAPKFLPQRTVPGSNRLPARAGRRRRRRRAELRSEAEGERAEGRPRGGWGWMEEGYEGLGGSIVACTGRCGCGVRTRWFYRLASRLHETRLQQKQSRRGWVAVRRAGLDLSRPPARRAAVIREAVRDSDAFFRVGSAVASQRGRTGRPGGVRPRCCLTCA